MDRKVASKRDPFAFSLGGFTAIGWALAPRAIADDRINAAYDARRRRAASMTGVNASALSFSLKPGPKLCPIHFEEAPCFCEAA